ncbi:hypothetical protein M0802_005239 [Mischocyttarus mexicanus]|nr:hypothetical protein M0802_005239 [Mischocyttarus mexicanus]
MFAVPANDPSVLATSGGSGDVRKLVANGRRQHSGDGRKLVANGRRHHSSVVSTVSLGVGDNTLVSLAFCWRIVIIVDGCCQRRHSCRRVVLAILASKPRSSYYYWYRRLPLMWYEQQPAMALLMEPEMERSRPRHSYYQR